MADPLLDKALSRSDIQNRGFDQTNNVHKTSLNQDSLDKINIKDYDTNSEQKKQTVGTSSVNVQFTQDVTQVLIINKSPSDTTVHVSLDGGTATTNDTPLEQDDSMSVSLKIVQATGISFIADAAGAEVHLVGTWTP